MIDMLSKILKNSVILKRNNSLSELFTKYEKIIIIRNYEVDGKMTAKEEIINTKKDKMVMYSIHNKYNEEYTKKIGITIYKENNNVSKNAFIEKAIDIKYNTIIDPSYIYEELGYSIIFDSLYRAINNLQEIREYKGYLVFIVD